MQSIDLRVGANPRMSASEKSQTRDFYHGHPLSTACTVTDPEEREFHDKVCIPYSMQWQFHWVDRIAFWRTWVGRHAKQRSARAQASAVRRVRGDAHRSQ